MKPYSDSIAARLTGRHAKCIALCGDVQFQRVLNIGCYNGWFEQAMIVRGCRFAVGMDTERRWVTLAQQEVGDTACFIQGSALALPFQEALFGLVTMFDVLEHLPRGSELRSLQEIKRVLKPEGRLILSTPNWHPLSNLLDPAWLLIGHRHYKLEAIERLLADAGFAMVDHQKRGGLAELIGMLILYLFKQVRRESPAKRYIEDLREREYLGSGEGIATLFVVAKQLEFNHLQTPRFVSQR